MERRGMKAVLHFLFWVTLEPAVPQRTETFPSFKPRSEITCCDFSSISILPCQVRLYLHGREGALLSHIMLTRVTGTVKTRPLTNHI